MRFINIIFALFFSVIAVSYLFKLKKERVLENPLLAFLRLIEVLLIVIFIWYLSRYSIGSNYYSNVISFVVLFVLLLILDKIINKVKKNKK